MALFNHCIIMRHSGKERVFFPSLASCLSYVPEKGTVGASGDVAPLSHLVLGMLGEGQMWSPKTDWAAAEKVRKREGGSHTSAEKSEAEQGLRDA